LDTEYGWTNKGTRIPGYWSDHDILFFYIIIYLNRKRAKEEVEKRRTKEDKGKRGSSKE
jgi:hypothetical protein